MTLLQAIATFGIMLCVFGSFFAGEIAMASHFYARASYHEKARAGIKTGYLVLILLVVLAAFFVAVLLGFLGGGE
jgi:Na+/proline symporter